MTTIAAIRDALAALGPAAEHATEGIAALAATRNDFALWPPATAEHGPGAARRVAQAMAEAGHHSHLVADGQTMCLTRGCNQPPAPRQVLL